MKCILWITIVITVTLYSQVPLWGLEAIWRNDQVVGYLRRADYGFSTKRSIGYGYVHWQNAEPLTMKYLTEGEYAIESMDVKYKAQIHMKPQFDPENKRVQGIY